MRIGIDFDNTIACYTDVFSKVALDFGLLKPGFKGDKTAVKTALISSSGDETDWMRVQGQVYGAYMDAAETYSGFHNFLARASDVGADLLIISHKTERGHFDADQINLRDAARTWLDTQGIIGGADAPISSKNVFFEGTRDEKIARIAERNCTHFIDDLTEVLLHQDFPPDTRRYLFVPDASVSDTYGIFSCSGWHELEDKIFGSKD